MSSVNNVGNNSPVYTVNRPTPKPLGETAAPSAPNRGADTVELSGNSPISQALKTLKAGGDVRVDKVADIKARIAASSFWSSSYVPAATDRLLDELMK
jgi:hypothetical protein